MALVATMPGQPFPGPRESVEEAYLHARAAWRASSVSALLGSREALSHRVLDIPRPLRSDFAMNGGCWYNLVQFLDPRAACFAAAAARWTHEHLHGETRRQHARLQKIMRPPAGFRVADLARSSKSQAHPPLVTQIIRGEVENVQFILECGADPNEMVHDGSLACACFSCSDAFPAWAEWTFYDLARVMCTGPLASEENQQIEGLLKAYGGESDRVLCSRRELYLRLGVGEEDACDCCQLHKLFDPMLAREAVPAIDRQFRDFENCSLSLNPRPYDAMYASFWPARASSDRELLLSEMDSFDY